MQAPAAAQQQPAAVTAAAATAATAGAGAEWRRSAEAGRATAVQGGRGGRR